MTHRPAPRSARGFTLIEVMIAVLVVAVGLLGLAKMQALAFASTQISSARSLLSFQASSLAAAMHGNRAYWAAGAAAISFTTTATAVVDASNVLTASANCATGACTSAQLAAYDVQNWRTALVQQFPTATSSTSCPLPVGTAPVSCTVSVSWTEKSVAMNQATAASAAAATPQIYTLQVVP